MQKILHFHLPKTGGTAIRHHLIEQIGASGVSPSVVGMRLKDALLQWEGVDAISGHFSLHQGDQFPTDRCALTVLRDPIDRFLSEYFFAKSDNAGRLLDARMHAMDLDAYLESLSPKEEADFSLQIKMLYPLGIKSQEALSADEKLVASVRALDLFELVGIQDELEDFGSMLDTRFGWPSKPLELKNVTSMRIPVESLNPRQRQRLKKLLEKEFDLYEQARNRFRRDRRGFISRASSPSEQSLESTSSAGRTSDEGMQVKAPSNFGDRRCEIKDVFVYGDASGRDYVATGEQLIISINLLAHDVIDVLNIGIAIKDERGLLIFGTNSMLLGDVYSLSPGLYTARFRMLNRVAHGRYCVDVSLVRTLSHYEGCYHWLEEAAYFDVHESAVSHFEGRLLMDADIELAASSSEASWTRAPHTDSKHQVRSLGRVNKPLEHFLSSVTPMFQLAQLDGGSDVILPIRVENQGDEGWPTFGQQPIVISYRWLKADGTVMIADGLRTRLPSDLTPSSAAIVPLKVRVPYEKGNCCLLISLVQEGVAWFAEANPASSCILQINIT